MKRIKLQAYFAHNLGDDLMIEILLKRNPKCNFWVDSSISTSDRFSRYSNYENRTSIARKFGRLNHLLNILTFYWKEDFFLHWLFKRQNAKCCCGVYIGGSLFMQERGISAESRVKRERVKLETSPLFIIGANFGPYFTQEFKQEFYRFFRDCGGVTFRDQTSYALFADLPNTSYAPDVVLNLPLPTKCECDDTVLISVIDVSRRETIADMAEVYEKFIAGVCQECVKQGKTPVLMSFCENEGDVVAVRRIMQRLDSDVLEQTRSYEYAGDVDTAIMLFNKASFVLATRFHAMILALRFGKPFFSISYNDKIKWVLNDLGSDAFCEIQNVDSLCPKEVFTRCSQSIDAEAYIKKANHQFDQLDMFLKYENERMS